MAYDIALSELTDVIVNASRDLAGISGDALINQRIKTRLKIERGSWLLDDNGTLGSMIFAYFGDPMERFEDRLPDVVRQALENMTEIQIDNIDVSQNGSWQVLVEIAWSYLPEFDGGLTPDDLSGDTVIVPVSVEDSTFGVQTGGE